jgi:hypothetical protein
LRDRWRSDATIVAANGRGAKSFCRSPAIIPF